MGDSHTPPPANTSPAIPPMTTLRPINPEDIELPPGTASQLRSYLESEPFLDLTHRLFNDLCTLHVRATPAPLLENEQMAVLSGGGEADWDDAAQWMALSQAFILARGTHSDSAIWDESLPPEYYGVAFICRDEADMGCSMLNCAMEVLHNLLSDYFKMRTHRLERFGFSHTASSVSGMPVGDSRFLVSSVFRFQFDGFESEEVRMVLAEFMKRLPTAVHLFTASSGLAW